MAVITVKRGTTTPSTGHLTSIGELGFNYSSNELYIRSSSSVIKINGASSGGDYERVFNYEGAVATYKLNYNFSRDYVYKIHVITSSTGTNVNDSYFKYYTYNGSTPMSGAYACSMITDVYSTVNKVSSKNTSIFYLFNNFPSTGQATYATAKIIDFELTPTFESSVNNTYTWMAYGKTVTGASDQSNTPITTSNFAHVIDAAVGGIEFYSGFTIGNPSFSVSVYRYKRK